MSAAVKGAAAAAMAERVGLLTRPFCCWSQPSAISQLQKRCERSHLTLHSRILKKTTTSFLISCWFVSVASSTELGRPLPSLESLPHPAQC